MEHFLSPEGTERIDVPYVCAEYDGGDFMTYPQRHGWTESQLMGTPDFGSDRSPQEVEAFFQTWLYFGLVSSVLAIGGVNFTSSDLIRIEEDDRKFIDTSKLPALLQEWIDHEGVDAGQGKRLPADKMQRGKEVKIILEEGLKYANRYCNHRARQAAASYGLRFPYWPISDEIAMTILAVGEPLYHIATEIYAYYGRNPPRWGSSSILTRRLERMGWCPKDIPMFGDNAHVHSDYYFGSFPSPRRHLDHSQCSQAVCCAKTIDVAEYETKHLVEGCHCAHGTAFDAVLAIVKEGGIPIVTWNEVGPSKYELRAVKYEPSMKYIAISHVWADGAGNENANSLPECQLTRIQAMVDQLHAEEDVAEEGSTPQEQMGFWMDTLCIPIYDVIIDPQDGSSERLKRTEVHRKACIRQMVDIYQQADRVLILDAYIQEVSRTANDTTKSIRLFLSNWHRRLWTLQEGLLGRSLHFQFSDGAQTLDQISAFSPDKVEVCPEFYCSISGGCLSFFIPFYELLNVREKDMLPEWRVFTLIHDIRGRSTSKTIDEPICLATVLGLDVSEIVATDSHDERMEILYRILKRIDSRIIFNDFSRLPRNGFRWAPRTIIGQNKNPFPVKEKDPMAGRTEIGGGEDSVREGGNDPGDSDHDENTGVVAAGGGLIVTYPGIKLTVHRQEQVNAETKMLIVAPSAQPNLKYGVWLHPNNVETNVGDTDTAYPYLDDTLLYGIITDTQTAIQPGLISDTHAVPTEDTLKAIPPTEAVLGIIRGIDDNTERLVLEHVCRAHVELLDPRVNYGADTDMVSAEGSWLKTTQRWRVV